MFKRNVRVQRRMPFWVKITEYLRPQASEDLECIIISPNPPSSGVIYIDWVKRYPLSICELVEPLEENKKYLDKPRKTHPPESGINPCACVRVSEYVWERGGSPRGSGPSRALPYEP